MDENGGAGRSYPEGRHESTDENFMDGRRSAAESPTAARPGDELLKAASAIEPPSVPDGTFVKVASADHPLSRACEVAVYFQD